MEKILVIFGVVLCGVILSGFLALKLNRYLFIRRAKKAIKEYVEDGTFTKEAGEALEWYITKDKR